jgi:hypothetical protein
MASLLMDSKAFWKSTKSVKRGDWYSTIIRKHKSGRHRSD